MTRARVVLPDPGGPQKIMEGKKPAGLKGAPQQAPGGHQVRLAHKLG